MGAPLREEHWLCGHSETVAHESVAFDTAAWGKRNQPEGSRNSCALGFAVSEDPVGSERRRVQGSGTGRSQSVAPDAIGTPDRDCPQRERRQVKQVFEPTKQETAGTTPATA